VKIKTNFYLEKKIQEKFKTIMGLKVDNKSSGGEGTSNDGNTS
jgi:hypothetical protein